MNKKPAEKCAAIRCLRHCQTAHFVCRYHWDMLPVDIQMAMYKPATQFRAHIDAIKHILRSEGNQ